MKPLIVINLKTYQQGDESLKLAKAIQKVDKGIIVGAQPTDIYNLAKNTKLDIYSQHADGKIPGRNTGWILPRAIKKNHAKGVFLNHSEHRLTFNEIKETIPLCKKLNLKTMVFAKDLKAAKNLEKLKPDYIIIEPPELVSGKVSVSVARPELIKKISKELKTKFLVGAGIHTKEDIKTAMKLGASGVAFSSVITKAKNPEKKLRELLE
jgi:triosephosphate isomerase (TIM)